MSSFISVLLPEPLSANKIKQKSSHLYCIIISYFASKILPIINTHWDRGTNSASCLCIFDGRHEIFLALFQAEKKSESFFLYRRGRAFTGNPTWFQVPQTVVYKVLAIKFKIVGEHGSREFDIWIIYNRIAFFCLKNFSFFVFSFISTLNFGTIMKMIFDDKSDIIFAKQKKSGMSKDNTEYSNMLNGLDILCRFVMISKTKLRRGIMLRNIFLLNGNIFFSSC